MLIFSLLKGVFSSVYSKIFRLEAAERDNPFKQSWSIRIFECEEETNNMKIEYTQFLIIFDLGDNTARVF